jgi:dTDP-4-amino-4,6-dideoxygalactose transaminase
VGCFSFYPTKNLGAYGDGGMVVTSDNAIARRVRLLREYGWQERYVSAIRGGTNSRLDEVQAAVLRVKLHHLDEWTEARRSLAALYTGKLQGTTVVAPCEMPYARHVYHLYVVRCRGRDALRAALKERGIGTAIHYPLPVHLQPGYTDLGRGHGSFPVTEQLAKEILSLPMFPELRRDEVEQITNVIRDAGC